MLFYGLFIFISTFGLLNVIIGVIVENTMNASRGQKETAEHIAIDMKVEALNEIRKACFEFDTSGDFSISVKEMVMGIEKSEKVKEYLNASQMPLGWSGEEIFDLLDADGSGHIGYGEMLRYLLRAVVQDEKRQILDIKIGVNRLMRLRRLALEAFTGDRVEGTSMQALSSPKKTLQGTKPKLSRSFSSAEAGAGPSPNEAAKAKLMDYSSAPPQFFSEAGGGGGSGGSSCECCGLVREELKASEEEQRNFFTAYREGQQLLSEALTKCKATKKR